MGALSGLIGSVVAWVFNAAKETVKFVAVHLWTTFASVRVTAILYLART